MPGWINIPVKVETRERLDKVKGAKVQSYDSLINALIDQYLQPLDEQLKSAPSSTRKLD